MRPRMAPKTPPTMDPVLVVAPVVLPLLEGKEEPLGRAEEEVEL